jgi:UDP-N-acetylmuramoyl-L-alanyl-D-glutamate--2,6-diaminopimelate ligase
MKLSLLTSGFALNVDTGIQSSVDPDVTAVCYDSREVIPGAVFVAIEGFAVDGHRYIPEAVKKGAVAVVCRKPVTVDVIVIQVADPRAALAGMACRFFGHPADRMKLVGVTGTSGKTTVTYLLERILEKAGHRPGVVGTINFRYAGKVFANPVTTPESLELQETLRQMTDSGTTHVVMEVSSHSLDLHRVDGCRYDVAVFTNLSHDHLDHHGTMDRYWHSKKKLFSEYLKPAGSDSPVRAVVNTDDPRGRELAESLGARVLRTAAYGDGDIVPMGVVRDLTGIRGSITTPMARFPSNRRWWGISTLKTFSAPPVRRWPWGFRPQRLPRASMLPNACPGGWSEFRRAVNGLFSWIIPTSRGRWRTPSWPCGTSQRAV